ncbi:type 1 glutamine amidotransferase domain-containing protein [Ancylomarina sp. YFZ004]
MLRFKKFAILKWSLSIFAFLIVLFVAFGFWFISLIPIGLDQDKLSQTQAKDLPYLSDNNLASRGKILAVVTSCETMGSSNEKTGYELTELSRAYYVFKANGFEVDIASLKGGNPPVVIDDDDMGIYDYAFLNDTLAQNKIRHSIQISEVKSESYDAIYFAGGKGAMFDFPDNESIQSILKQYYESGKVIGAVCHGPAALVNVRLSDGSYLLNEKQVCSFTNKEELFLKSDAKEIFPFLLQDKLIANGAQFKEGHQYLKNITEDGILITGQNPWSTWAIAEAMIKKIGYTPVKREITAEELTINILNTYESDGYSKTKSLISKTVIEHQKSVDGILLGMHCIVAVLNLDIGKFYDLIRLLKYSNSILEEL